MDNVTKVFGKRTVINGVSISVEQGEVVGLLGPNGAGKSTTFNILVGLEKPSTGIVELGERDITTFSLQRRARLGVAYMPQEPSIFRGLSVRDNILLILQETSVPQNQHNHKLEELLEIFDLKQIEGTLGKALSGGERRRTELARALASNSSGGPPLILLVDEPFSGVDPIGVAQMQSKLRSLCEVQNMGILITDHNVHETMKICDRAYVVCQGQVLASGTPPQVYTNETLLQVAVTRNGRDIMYEEIYAFGEKDPSAIHQFLRIEMEALAAPMCRNLELTTGHFVPTVLGISLATGISLFLVEMSVHKMLRLETSCLPVMNASSKVDKTK